MRTILDRISDFLGHVAAWLFFTTGAVLGYEVTARYVFNAPTIWAAEVARLLMVWGVFLAMAGLLRRRKHISIVVLSSRLSRGWQRGLEVFSLVVIAVFSVVAIWYGWGIAADSLQRGRSTGTMLNIPNWWSEIVIPIGFGLLLVQCVIELTKLFKRAGGAPAPTSEP